MKAVYKIAAISKQSHQQYMLRSSDTGDYTAYYIGLIEEARVHHPVIGLEKIYYLFNPEGIGRDSFVAIGTMAGYALDAVARTTWKGGYTCPYGNLLTGKKFNNINQVWATDITYFKVGETFYYISMILDLYSRRIVGWRVSESLHAEHSLQVLKMAIRLRGVTTTNQLIHHSDKGVQYTCNTYIKVLKKHQIGISMCYSVYENTMMERLNGIIKNAYLIHWAPKSHSHLVTLLDRAVNNYNSCPHGKLGMLSPVQFEKEILKVPTDQRTKLEVFTINKSTNKNEDPNQLELFDSNLFFNQKGQHFSG